MRIATLQFSPKLGQVEYNISRATELGKQLQPGAVDILVLPELAFSGYNFPSLAAIEPFLEPTAAGASTEWARQTAQRLKCYVIVGYPEITSDGERFNSTVMVDSAGQVLGKGYRKSFLYYTDETWAQAGDGFSRGCGTVTCVATPQSDQVLRIAQGICMDINPHNFTAPWQKYEFANHAVESQADLVLLSMAWLADPHDPNASPVDPFEELDQPVWPKEESELGNFKTLSYWLERITPIILQSRTTTIVIANRSGQEGNARYAGTSCVLRAGFGRVAIASTLGRGEEGVLLVDNQAGPNLMPAANDDGDVLYES